MPVRVGASAARKHRYHDLASCTEHLSTGVRGHCNQSRWVHRMMPPREGGGRNCLKCAGLSHLLRSAFDSLIVTPGLLVAQRLGSSGVHVDIYDRMPTPGLKFLIAGRGGLNLTHSEAHDRFKKRYGGTCDLQQLLDRFGPAEMRSWVVRLLRPSSS